MEMKINNDNNPGTVNSGSVNTPANNPAVTNPEDNAPYTDKRSITISPVTNYSAYRNVNKAALGNKKHIIGGSVTSCQILSSNKGEVEAYFPQLIGLSPNNPEFVTRVKNYLSNIQFNVSEQGSTLDISFFYNKKSDYLAIKAKEDRINAEYDKINRANTKSIKDGVKAYVDALNELESTKYLYGRPINLSEYLLYRHCLLYKEVAKDIALINSDNTLRFYIKNEAREAEKAKRLVENRKQAMRAFIELNASDAKRKAVYVQMVINNNGNLSEALLKSKDEQESAIMDFVNKEPAKFNKMVADKTLLTKAFIETLIVRGELIRAEYNQQISTPDGTFIGSNINEAVAYFDNPAHKEIKEAFENKLKLF